mmetsp:Transcript_11175/g.18113  ORF Transcript_11175/g.18113 Transcript_11175/m.18113 type:complete len:236 (-) Transcript_11175:107-814(-)
MGRECHWWQYHGFVVGGIGRTLRRCDRGGRGEFDFRSDCRGEQCHLGRMRSLQKVETPPRSGRRPKAPLPMVLLHEQNRPRTLPLLRPRGGVRIRHHPRIRHGSTHPKTPPRLGPSSALQRGLRESTTLLLRPQEARVDGILRIRRCRRRRRPRTGRRGDDAREQGTLPVDSMLQSQLREVEDAVAVDGRVERDRQVQGRGVVLRHEHVGREGGELRGGAGEFAGVGMSSLGHGG